MTSSEAIRKIDFHHRVVIVAMIASSLVFPFLPWDITDLEWIIFFGVLPFWYIFHTREKSAYKGFGVAERVNRIAGIQILPNFGGLAWGNFAPYAMARLFYRHLAIWVVFGIALIADYKWGFLGFEVEFSRSIAICIVAHIFARIGALYTWFFADCYVVWYFPERLLRDILVKRNFSGIEIERIIELARAEDVFLAKG